MAGDIMTVNINRSTLINNANIHIDSVSINHSSNSNKAYYQHRHPGIEIHYIINGQCKVTTGEKSFALSTNTILLIPAGTYHDITTTSNTSRLSFSFMIQKAGNPENSTGSFYGLFSTKDPVAADIHDSEAQNILGRMIALLENSPNDPYITDKLLTLCCTALLELIPYIANADPHDNYVENTQILQDVSFKIDSFMGRNFMLNNAKNQMADDLYISPRQLQRVIQKNYGMSYREKLTETRIQIAIDLLRNSTMPIHKISEILGYSCSANFSAFIKRNTGKTPSQIRNE